MALKNLEELKEAIKNLKPMLLRMSKIQDNISFLFFIIQFAQYLVCQFTVESRNTNVYNGKLNKKLDRVTGPKSVYKVTGSNLLRCISNFRNAFCHPSKLATIMSEYNLILKHLNEVELEIVNDDVVKHCIELLKEYLSTVENRNAFKIYMKDIYVNLIVELETEDGQNSESIQNRKISSF